MVDLGAAHAAVHRHRHPTRPAGGQRQEEGVISVGNSHDDPVTRADACGDAARQPVHPISGVAEGAGLVPRLGDQDLVARRLGQTIHDNAEGEAPTAQEQARPMEG
jgi:hypothetical protein